MSISCRVPIKVFKEVSHELESALKKLFVEPFRYINIRFVFLKMVELTAFSALIFARVKKALLVFKLF